jgi:hypothetical protein
VYISDLKNGRFDVPLQIANIVESFSCVIDVELDISSSAVPGELLSHSAHIWQRLSTLICSAIRLSSSSSQRRVLFAGRRANIHVGDRLQV